MDGFFVVAKSWPRPDRGYGIALASSLRQYSDAFPDVRVVAVTSHAFPEKLKSAYPGVTWKQIPVNKESLRKRFLRSLAVSCPASVVQYASREVTREIARYIRRSCSSSGRMVVVFEDIPPAYHLPALRRSFPHARFVLRSHNLIGEVFEGFDKEGGMVRRIVWKAELEKLRRFESSILETAHIVWAISSRDSGEYDRRYGKRCDGVLGVHVNPEPYRDLPVGDLQTVVYVGSADLRKGHGLARFIHGVWKPMVQNNSDARLILAGRDTDRFSSRSLNIEGRGYVGNDSDVLSAGTICINPQERGSGIKLKSLIAMLAGKVLISTSKGLEGIEGVNGTHFFRVDEIEEMRPLIAYLMDHKRRAHQVGRSGRQLAIAMNKESDFASRVRPLLLRLRESME